MDARMRGALNAGGRGGLNAGRRGDLNVGRLRGLNAGRSRTLNTGRRRSTPVVKGGDVRVLALKGTKAWRADGGKAEECGYVEKKSWGDAELEMREDTKAWIRGKTRL